MPNPTEDPEILRALLEFSPDMITLSEFSGRVVFVNPAGQAMVGLAELREEPFLTTVDFFTKRGLSVSPQVEEGLKTVGFWHGRSELCHQVTGVGIPVAISAFVIRRDGEKPDLIASIIRDRTESVRRDHELEESVVTARRNAREKHALAELSRLAVSGELPELLEAAAAAAATMIDVESAAVARHAKPTDEFLHIDAVSRSIGPNAVVPAGDGSLAGYAIAHNTAIICSDTRSEHRFETAAMASLGLLSGVAVPVPISSPDPWGALAVYSSTTRDYSDQEIEFLVAVTSVLSTALKRIDLDAQLRRRSMHDALTGLPNRALAYEVIDDALDRAKSGFGSVALLLLDIDDFKIINDSLGHDAGDRALVRFSRRLTKAIAPGDTVTRLGGDEFLIICEGVDGVSHAEKLARHIATSIAAPMSIDDAPMPLSGSIGIAVSEPSSTRRELVHQADLAMYRAKDSGGGYAVFDTGDLYDADRVLSLSIDLRGALARGDLSLAYQRLVDLTTGETVAVEALARWTHPVHGLVAPSEFVAVAERTGLATALGSWALNAACTQAAKWREFCDVDIRVNVSALQLRNPAFPGEVAAVLKETGLPASALGLEITETVWVADTARVADTIAELHTMGVALALDDLGKGHSSISYLGRYPMFECFKIDKSFIAALPEPRAVAVVAAIVALAKAFKVTVVGEGVETQDQRDALVSTGCDLGQGYFFGRPESPEEMTKTLS